MFGGRVTPGKDAPPPLLGPLGCFAMLRSKQGTRYTDEIS